MDLKDKNQSQLDKIATHPLQTQAWADFRREWGNEVLETPYGLIVVNRLPLIRAGIGTFIRGPKPTPTMLKDLKKLAQEKNLILIKLEPNVKKDPSLIKVLKDSGCVPGKTLFTPTTFSFDLTLSQEELLKSFKSKTRYNIRYAERKGVEVIEDNSPAAFKTYLQLMRQTVKRQGFYAHTQRYHELMWKHLRQANIAHLLVAQYQKTPLTAWILFHWRKTLYYPYGASSGTQQNLQPNSAIMWAAIKLGKDLGAETFDLWGREEGKGFTRFKEGFNPQVIEFLSTWDLVVNQAFYVLYRLAESLRWPILRLKAKLTRPQF